MSDDFYRIKRLPPYVIAEVNGMRAAARAGGEDIIDLGMGNPDLPPPEHVIEKLIEVTRKPDAHGYSQSKGIPGLRRAQANYYGRRFGVDLDPETEVVVTMGSKEGLASLATAITAPGDVVLAPNPSYPIHTFGFIIAGATIRAVPTTPDEAYFESLFQACGIDPVPADWKERVRIGSDRKQSGTARENLTGLSVEFPRELPETQRRLVDFAAPGLRALLGYS